MEHPQYPTWLCRADVPSVWCLAAVRALRTLCCLSITSFDQCTMGSIARKPTTILHLRLPRLRGALLRGGRGGRCAHPPRFHERLQGRGLHGNFKTSCGKIYQQKLNAIIADSIAAHLRTRFQDLALSAELPAVLHPLVCIFFEDTATSSTVCPSGFHARDQVSIRHSMLKVTRTTSRPLRIG